MPTRPTISWSDLRGRTVGVWGLGVEGRANVSKLDALGVEPVLVDDAPPAGGLDGRPVLATAVGGMEALARCEAVVKTPGLSRYRTDVEALVAGGTPVVGGLGLWLAEADLARVLCITGTKGKSTTTAIAGHLLVGLGYEVVTGGNLGVPPYAPGAPADADWWVVEVSSYQATDVAVSPPVVAVTSLHPDHLPWHRGDPETYYADKLSLCSRPGADLTVANGDSPLLRDHRDLLGPRVEWVTAPDGSDALPPWAEPLGLLGRHNARNARIARAALAALGVPEAADDAALGGRGRGVRAAGEPAVPGGDRVTASCASTTACPPTSCPHWPRSRRSPAGGWRCWWAGRTGASTTPRSPRAWRSGTPPPPRSCWRRRPRPACGPRWPAGPR